MRIQEIQKTKITSFPKHVFSVFCFQEHKTILGNSNQTGPQSPFFSHNLSITTFLNLDKWFLGTSSGQL